MTLTPTRTVLVESPSAPGQHAAVSGAPFRAALPAWPLLALLYGFPVYWATGLSLFAPLAFAGIMAVFMILRRGLRSTPGVLLWFTFLAWVCVCAVSVTGVMELIGFVQRTSDLVAVGVALLYYVNARESIRPRHILTGFAVIWFTVVILGTLATFFPDFRLNTPLAQVLPGSLLGNELVRELVQPRLAEVQQPWGAEEPFVRPAAPFPYTNSWGMAYAMLTPVMILIVIRMRRIWPRAVVSVAILASVYPAAQTSNRGMMIAIAVFAVFLGIRFLLAGSFRTALGIFGGLAVTVAIAAASGVFAAIAERQEVSDTTSGRGTIYVATIDKVLQSPLVGWATPDIDVTIGIALGTQGYAWTLMYCYGFIGLALFVLFLVRVIVATWSLRSGTAYVLQGVVAIVFVTIWFYGLGITQSLILLLAAGMLSRAKVDGEVLADG